MQGVFCVVFFLALCFPIKAGFKPSISLPGLAPGNLSPGSQLLDSPSSGGTIVPVQSAPAVVNLQSSEPGSSIFSGAAPVNPRSKVTTFFEVADDAFWSSNLKYIKLTQDDDKDKQTCQDECEENSSCALAIICNATIPTTPTTKPTISIPGLGQSLGLTLNIGKSSSSDKHTCILFRESSEEIQLDEAEKNSWGDECMYLVINPICREASSEKGWEKHGNPQVGSDQIVTQPYKCKSGYKNGKEGPPRTTCDADGVFASTGGCDLVQVSKLTPPVGNGTGLDTNSKGIVQPVLYQPLLNFPFSLRTATTAVQTTTTQAPAVDPPKTNPPVTDPPTTVAPTANSPTTTAQTTANQTPAIDPPTINPPTTALQTTTTQAPAIDQPVNNPPAKDPPTKNSPTTVAQTSTEQTTAIDPPATNPPTPTAPIIERPQDCPSAFNFDPTTYLCFQIIALSKKFIYTKSTCERMASGSRLAILNTQEEMTTVGTLLKTYGVQEPVWVDAEQYLQYFEPSENSLTCIQMNKHGKLEEADCSEGKPFVCEVPVPRT